MGQTSFCNSGITCLHGVEGECQECAVLDSSVTSTADSILELCRQCNMGDTPNVADIKRELNMLVASTYDD